MRVLHVYRTYYPDPPGGLQEAIRQICLGTREYGVSSTIFTLSSTPEPAHISREEANVYREQSWMSPASCDIGGIKAIKRFAELAEKADVIHYHFPWPFADLMHLLVRPKTVSVMTYHSDIVRQKKLNVLYQPLQEYMFRQVAAIVATSPNYKNTSSILVDEAVSKKVQVIPLGISEQSTQSIVDSNVLNRIKIDLSQPFFLFIGVLREYKGLRYLVEAAKKTRANIVIAGTGPEEKRLHALSERISCTNVIFTGQVSDEEKIALITNCHALVLSSHLRSEAFGMVLVEASMYGKAMISCEVGSGTSYVNIDGETGFVVKPEEPEQLAKAMNKLIEDRNLASEFGNAAFERYQGLFSGKALGAAYFNLYKKVINEK